MYFLVYSSQAIFYVLGFLVCILVDGYPHLVVYDILPNPCNLKVVLNAFTLLNWS